MKTETENQTFRMRSYLLGLLPESEQIALEQAFFADSEILERLQEVEFDLVDGYVRGKLPSDERGQFEHHYLASPQHCERVEFAKELVRQADALPLDQPEGQPSKQSVPFWQWLLANLQTPQFAFSAAMAAILLLVGGIWLARQRATLQQEIARLQAERSAEQRRSGKLADQIAQQQEQNSQLNAELERLRIENTPTTQPTLFSFILLSGVRGGSEQQSLKIPAGTDLVRLLMKIENGNYRSYHASVRQIDGRGNWNQSVASSKQTDAGITVSVKIPANKLGNGDYILTLTGIDAAGSTEEINRYFFRVANK